MLRCSAWQLGRWKSTDFLRGRSKKGGSVHIRHTHGSKGRYKRLSTLYGLRDGRRHASNHMGGGLGIKIGGGLFGLRIPRQHTLSTMTREEYELEMYGHPNITNPYREYLEEHPSLQQVMSNAALHVHLVFLLPRVPRTRSRLRGHGGAAASSSSASAVAATTSGEAAEDVVPDAWRSALAPLTQLFHSDSDCTDTGAGTERLREVLSSTTVHCATLDASVQLPGSTLVAAVAPDTTTTTTEDLTSRALGVLYADHAKGQKLRVTDASARAEGTATVPRKRGEPRAIPFFGKGLQGTPMPPFGQHSVAGTLTSSALSRVRALEAESHRMNRLLHVPDEGELGGREYDASTVRATYPMQAEEEGVMTLLARLRRADPNALCLCLRPTAGVFDQEDCDNCKRSLPPTDSSFSPSAASGTTRGSGASRSRASVPLLTEDVEVDEEVGVWRQTRSTVSSLLRWHYSANDPRAHSGDAMPHSQRRLSVVLLIDTSKPLIPPRASSPHSRRGKSSSPWPRKEGEGHGGRRAPSLLSRSHSEQLEKLGFRALLPSTVPEVLHELEHWCVGYQWEQQTVQRARKRTRLATKGNSPHRKGEGVVSEKTASVSVAV